MQYPWHRTYMITVLSNECISAQSQTWAAHWTRAPGAHRWVKPRAAGKGNASPPPHQEQHKQARGQQVPDPGPVITTHTRTSHTSAHVPPPSTPLGCGAAGTPEGQQPPSHHRPPPKPYVCECVLCTGARSSPGSGPAATAFGELLYPTPPHPRGPLQIKKRKKKTNKPT